MDFTPVQANTFAEISIAKPRISHKNRAKIGLKTPRKKSPAIASGASFS